jgi:hypothetical protein
VLQIQVENLNVAAPEPDEDGDPITTMVVNWQPPGASGAPGGAGPPSDPWAASRRQDQRTAVLRLKRTLMAMLAEHGVELLIPPDGPVMRMIDQELVRAEYYSHTPADGSPDQKSEFRRKRFSRALDWAEDQSLVAIHEIGGITYLRLARPDEGDEERGESG